MKIDIITLFPELISGYFEDSIMKRAAQNGLVSVSLHQLRDFAYDKHRQVDDTPYGGGSGMLLRVDVLGNAVEYVKSLGDGNSKVIYLSPQGKKLTNTVAREFSEQNHMILVCGRYEGVDQRFIDIYVDYEISIGDYILSGGELAAAVFTEVVSRFIPGVIGSEESVASDSFENSRLKYPQYTRPREYLGNQVPDVLLSGNHEEIKKWREAESEKATKTKRGDLI
ncbi:MAG: tRNA (guanosine(37)-N1)-methyltransferase TrmD [Oligoflexia bacterium]|nr:tRNA (guanosine(37)-N1)-methyltransferase TrmD [Oligoflexia bacterium]